MIPRDFLMKKEMYYQAGNYDLTFKLFEDWDLKIRLAFKYKFYFTWVHGIVYRRHRDSLSQVPLRNRIHWMKKAFAKNIKLTKPDHKIQLARDFEVFIKTVNKAGKAKD